MSRYSIANEGWYMEKALTKRTNDLSERTFKFAIKILKLLKNIKYSRENDVVKNQLAKSATSVGANYEEAQELKNIFATIVKKAKAIG